MADTDTILPGTILEVGERVVRLIGTRMREVVIDGAPFTLSHKGTTDIVTEIDLWAEEQIKKAVSELFPGHVVIGEESYRELEKAHGKSLEEISAKGLCWIVDPIDGTSNFASRIPHCSVSIGVLEDGKRIAGLVYDPFLDELFTAVKGQGAFCNGRPLAVSGRSALLESIVGTGFPGDYARTHWNLFAEAQKVFSQRCRRIRLFGSSAIELCWVAAGRLDCFFEYYLNPWDVAAGSLIVEEAKGKMGCFIEPQKPYSIFGKSTLGANAALFNEMLALAHGAYTYTTQKQC